MKIKALMEQRKAQLDANARISAAVEARGFKYEGSEKADLEAGVARVAELDGMIALAQEQLKAESTSPAASFGYNVAGTDSENGEAPQAGGVTMSDRNLRDANGNVDMQAVLSAMRQFATSRSHDVSRVVSANGPFRTFAEQVDAVVKAGKSRNRVVDERLNKIGATAHGASEGIDADGGFLVQQDFLAPMLDNIIANGQIANLCTRLSTSKHSVVLPRLKETSRANGSRNGGVRVNWTNEGGEITPSKPQFERQTIQVEKMTALVPVTAELAEDAPFLSGYINTLVASEMSFVLDDAILRGDGIGKPLGVLNGPNLVTAAKESGQEADSLIADNIFNMLGRMVPRSKGRATWHGNQELYPQLLKLKDGANNNIFLPGQNIANMPVDRLLGRNYSELEQCSAPGDVGDILLADWSQYLLIDRGGMRVDTSIHFYFDTDEEALRFILRVGGAPMGSAPLTPYKGTKTLSPFVTLQAR